MSWSKYSFRLFVTTSLLLVIAFTGVTRADYYEGILTGSNIGSFNGNISVDGSIADWDVYWVSQGLGAEVNRPNSEWQSGLAGVSWWVEDGIGDNGRVTPGRGGQNYDHEAAYLGIDSAGFYGAIVTGSEQAGNHASGSNWYDSGDVFFDIDADSDWDFALAASDHNGLTAGHLYKPKAKYTNKRWWTKAKAFPISTPAQLRSRKVESFFDLGSDFIYTNAVTTDDNRGPGDPYVAADHNVLEFVIPWDILTAYDIQYNGNMLMHFTQTCGNDIIELQHASLPSGGPPHVIPEPATIALLACGIAGLIARKRRCWKLETRN